MPGLVLGFEICEDLWSPDSPSVRMAKDGAAIIGNLSASNDVVGKDAYRRQLVTMQSAKLLCGYVYASAGAGESTSDLVFGAHQMIAENGALLAERRFEGGLLVSEIDVQRLACERRRTQSLGEGSGNEGCGETSTLTEGKTKLTRHVSPCPSSPRPPHTPGPSAGRRYVWKRSNIPSLCTTRPPFVPRGRRNMDWPCRSPRR